MRAARPILTYSRDRKLLSLTAIRLIICVALIAAEIEVTLPTSNQPLPLESFLALGFALPAALTLPERLQWVGHGKSSALLHVLRTCASSSADALCLVAILVASRATHHVALVGGPLVILGIGYAASALSARLSWLVVAALGSIGLLSLAHAPNAVIDYVPAGIGAAVFALGFAVYAVVGPRELDA